MIKPRNCRYLGLSIPVHLAAKAKMVSSAQPPNIVLQAWLRCDFDRPVPVPLSATGGATAPNAPSTPDAVLEAAKIQRCTHYAL